MAPLPSVDEVIINYRGGRQTFPYVPYHRVAKGDVDPKVFKGKIVLVGVTSPVHHDLFPTPFERGGAMPGVEIHAHALDTLMRGDHIRPVPAWLSPVLALIRDLWQDGVDVLVHDPDVRPEEMLGSNREYLERQLPQIKEILRPRLSDVLTNCGLAIVTQNRTEFRSAIDGLEERVEIIDLTGSRQLRPAAVSERVALD